MSLKIGDKVKVCIPDKDFQTLYDTYGIVEDMLKYNNQICTVKESVRYDAFTSLREDPIGFHWHIDLLKKND